MDTAEPVWITGVGAATPLGCELAEIEANLLAGRSGVSLVTRFPTDDYPSRIAAQLSELFGRDAVTSRSLLGAAAAGSACALVRRSRPCATRICGTLTARPGRSGAGHRGRVDAALGGRQSKGGHAALQPRPRPRLDDRAGSSRAGAFGAGALAHFGGVRQRQPCARDRPPVASAGSGGRLRRGGLRPGGHADRPGDVRQPSRACRGATPIRPPRHVRLTAAATASCWARGGSRSSSSGRATRVAGARMPMPRWFCVLSPGEKQGYYQDFGDLSQLAKALEETFVYDGIYSRHRGRIHGRPAGRLSRHRFIGFIQNHDQVGNRAIGDRLVQVVGMDRAKIAAAVVLLSPFIPMLFQGEEWAASSPFQYFADHEDPAMARLVSEGRKREFAVFGWNPALIPGPEVPATFERSKLNWEERDTGDHREMLDWYRALVRLRGAKYSPTNRDPEKIHVEFREQPEWFSISINGLIINCNLSSDIVKLAAPLDKQVLLASREGWRRAEDQVVLPSDSLVILG